MQSDREEAATQNNNDRDLTVVLNGSWHRRGHVSLHGVVTCTSVDTGKVIDVDILSKHCTCKDKLKDKHEDACSAQYKGTSGGMDGSDVVNIFNHSILQCNVRYTNYLGDGDCKGTKLFSRLSLMDTVASFNEINLVLCHVYERLDYPPRRNCVQAVKKLDSYRIDEAKRMVKNIEMKGRLKRKAANRKLEDLCDQQEDPDEPSYGAGIY
ncbi:hypothetical protein PR048_014090 [Dryococelus australis]|uniref:Mutator-like transposase domain-containing protein n=1 Tax=Dryococelus australis TaxID=614101 RepID=A0ABQ9HUG5_9NEOP|nr:hypothetical protein PR048_014090 [Dryococelus australis]